MKTWKIDPIHSSANFSVKHMMIARVRGTFEQLQGTLHYDPVNPSALKVEATIAAASINTHDVQRDTHLRSADFFAVEKYPSIHFTSTEVQQLGHGELQVLGELTIRGVTKIVALKVEGPSQELKDPWGNLRLGLTAVTQIKRSEYGLTWNAALEDSGVLVGDDVTITLEVQFIGDK